MNTRHKLLDDRTLSYMLYELLHADELCALPHFEAHSRESMDLYIEACRTFAREDMFPSYKPMDAQPPTLEDGRVSTHPALQPLWQNMVELGVLTAVRAHEVGGQQMPYVVHRAASAYMMAANASAFGFARLTSGAAHLIEAYGSDDLRREYMDAMYAGRWSGTLAFAEPEAGSSLADVQTRATPSASEHYLMRGSKVFLFGGDQTLTENIVHLVLARIDGAPAGIHGLSLFVVPKWRVCGADLVDNDTRPAGAMHKLGWRGLPSIALNLGEQADCHGYLVGEAHQGIVYLDQLMIEARINVGLQSVATASVAYHAAVDYARTRAQGRPSGRAASEPQVPLLAHADVRRMLLRQKAITEGGLLLVLWTSKCQDLATHAASDAERQHASLLLELLTPIAKTFPAERCFESNTLALQVHGSYGYANELLPEAWLRDQKLNSIQEGATGVQSNDLLGRKVIRMQGTTIQALREEVERAVEVAIELGVDTEDCSQLQAALETVVAVSSELTSLGSRSFEGALTHSHDYMEMLSTLVVGWMWLLQATRATLALESGSLETTFYEGKLRAARYWFRTEIPRIVQLAALCLADDDTYVRMDDASW